MRRPHRLEANHVNTALHHLYTVDTEAHRHRLSPTLEEQTLRLGVVEHWKPQRERQPEHLSLHRFTTADECWRSILSDLPRNSAGTVIAHNASYDMRLLDMFRQLPALGWALDWTVTDSPPFIAEWREVCAECDRLRVADGRTPNGRRHKGCRVGAHRTLRVWDTFNLAQVALAELAQLVGAELLPYPDDQADDDAWFAKCEADVTALSRWYRRYVAWLAEHDMGQLSPTIASQAWHAYRHGYTEAQFMVHANERVTKLERRALMGGRVECHYIGEAPRQRWSQVDVNSLYPALMAKRPVPTELVTTKWAPSEWELRDLLHSYLLVADVEVTTPVPAYPAHVNGELVFPVGRFSTTLTTPELRHALYQGHVTGIGLVAVYRGKVAFQKYVRALWQLRMSARRDGDPVGDQLCKLLMTNLAGKFAQRGITWRHVADAPLDRTGLVHEWHADRKQWLTVRTLAGKVEIQERTSEAEHSFPAVTAHVNAYGRMALWELMNCAGRDEVAYTDTDSLVVSPLGARRLTGFVDPTVLGALKLEHQADRLVLLGPKAYILGTKRRMKGIKADAELLPDGAIRQTHWHGLTYGLKSGTTDRVYLETVTRRWRKAYSKGVVNPDGTVAPIRLPF